MTANPARKTLDQLRAAHAWQATENADKAFGRQAKRLGPRILTAGLGPAVQFLVAKDEKLAEALQAWLLDSGPTKRGQGMMGSSGPHPGTALVSDIINGDSDRLRWLTAEALAYLAWVTRYCEARGLTEDGA